jgi:molybdopterin molybdotransferase
MHEKTTLSPDGQTVQIPPPVQPRQNIMAQGEEMKSGQVVLPADTTLRPQELGLLATVGKSTIQVFRRPIVALLSTGDEVVEPGAPLRHGQIRNSNAPMLAAQITRAGSQPHYLGIAPDSPTVLRSCIERGLQSDVLIITGGVSAGKVDLVPDILAELGVTAIFHKVAVKPGKPLLFGVKNHTLIFGLPGNPASCHIGFELFARPALRKLLGRPLPHLPRTTHAILATELPLKSDRQTYLPVQLRSTAQGELATPLPWRGSGDLFTICLAHAFAIFPPSQQTYPANSPIEILLSESDF